MLILSTSNLVGPLLPFGNGGSEAELAQGRKAQRWHWRWETRVLLLLHSPGRVPTRLGAPWREAALGLVYVGGWGATSRRSPASLLMTAPGPISSTSKVILMSEPPCLPSPTAALVQGTSLSSPSSSSEPVTPLLGVSLSVVLRCPQGQIHSLWLLCDLPL